MNYAVFIAICLVPPIYAIKARIIYLSMLNAVVDKYGNCLKAVANKDTYRMLKTRAVFWIIPSRLYHWKQRRWLNKREELKRD